MKEQTEVLILSTPEPIDSLVNLQQQIGELLKYAEAAVVASTADTVTVTEDLSIIAGIKKELESRRKEYVTPLNNEVSRVNNVFKSVRQPLDHADSILRKKLIDYQQEQARIAREIEQQNKEKQEKAVQEMLTYGEILSDTTQEVVPHVAKTTRGVMGTSRATTVKKWRLVDWTQVPDEFKQLDDTKIGKLVRAGIAYIPGIEIYEEATLTVRANRGGQ